MTNSQTPFQRRIGLLGGSFNPAHAGHREITLAALGRLGLDAVWWLVTPGNPLKDPEQYAPYTDRLKQARRIAGHPDIVISDFENRHDLQYTVDTLERIKLLNEETAFVWLMGADSFENFHRWKNWRRIAELAPMAVFNRPGYGERALNSEAAQTLSAFQHAEKDSANLAAMEPPAWIFIDDTDNPASSTDLRKKQQPPTETPPT